MNERKRSLTTWPTFSCRELSVERLIVCSMSRFFRSAVEISARSALPSMTAWYTRRHSPSEATKQDEGEFETRPSVVLPARNELVRGPMMSFFIKLNGTVQKPAGLKLVIP